jgi:hypothetical protein
MKANALFAVSVAGYLVAACGPNGTPVGQVTSPSQPATPTTVTSPGPAPGACDALHRCLAVVALRGINPWVIRDITNISDAKTVSTLMTSPPQFVSGTEIAYADETGLFRMPLTGFPKTLISNSGQGISAFAWSPNGGSVAFLVQSASGMALHLQSGGQGRAIEGSIPTLPVVGCESPFCGDMWDFRLSYSPDGKFISLVESIAGVNAFRLWSSDGRLLISSDTEARPMSTWSDHTFYFPGATGVDMLRDGISSPFLPGVTWIRPLASPAGGQIVYATKDAQGWSHTFVVDTTTRKVLELKKARSAPAFLASRYIWYMGERTCVAADHCPLGWSVVASGKTYIYDLTTGTETASVITQLFDIWPHAA